MKAVRTLQRYQCDFCTRRLTIHHMRRHEAGCYFNPRRVCRCYYHNSRPWDGEPGDCTACLHADAIWEGILLRVRSGLYEQLSAYAKAFFDARIAIEAEDAKMSVAEFIGPTLSIPDTWDYGDNPEWLKWNDRAYPDFSRKAAGGSK